MIRKELRFFGIVQGVGFRFHCFRNATSLGLTGLVRNEYDGSVYCQIQGDEDKIKLFVDNLKHERFVSVERVEENQIPIKEEKDFKITY